MPHNLYNAGQFQTMKRILMIFTGIVLLFIIYTMVAGAFRYTSVCNQCGAVRYKTEWQVPRTSFAFFSHSSIRQTPVSLCLTTNQITPKHKHNWVFAQGGGNGIKCALGEAHKVRSTVESLEVAQLIQALERYDQRDFREKVVTSLLDDSTTRVVFLLALPTGGFTNEIQMQTWVSEQAESFDEMIAASKNK